MITKFAPGHDTPIDSADAKGKVSIELQFSQEMSSCDAVTKSITIKSTVEAKNLTARVDLDSVNCGKVSDNGRIPLAGAIDSAYSWTADLIDVAEGAHAITATDAKSKSGSTGSTDRFLIRVGRRNNPVVFPSSSNYSSTLLEVDGAGDFYVHHRAPGASKWRYSTNWGSSWSTWVAYKGGSESRSKITPQQWSGARHQAWEGKHVMVQYWSEPLGSSSFLQHGDTYHTTRRFPHLYLQGPFNKWGFGTGTPNELKLVDDSTWELHYMDEWPATFQFNVWGRNPDQQPDQSWVFGDMVGQKMANRLPPHRLPDNVFNITGPPAMPALSFRLILNNGTYQVEIHPQGNMWSQIAVFIALAILPPVLAVLTTWAFFWGFYRVKVNKRGFKISNNSAGWLQPWNMLPALGRNTKSLAEPNSAGLDGTGMTAVPFAQSSEMVAFSQPPTPGIMAVSRSEGR